MKGWNSSAGEESTTDNIKEQELRECGEEHSQDYVHLLQSEDEKRGKPKRGTSVLYGGTSFICPFIASKLQLQVDFVGHTSKWR